MVEGMVQNRNFAELEATSLYCPRCKKAQPVRTRLILVFVDGNEKFLYLCKKCGSELGSKVSRAAAVRGGNNLITI